MKTFMDFTPKKITPPATLPVFPALLILSLMIFMGLHC
jgi:hypothetical protein